MEQTTKQYRQDPKKRHYFAQAARNRRIKNRKCAVCGAQAYSRILLTGELRCNKHSVGPLKESLIKETEKKKMEETKHDEKTN
jgi:hypothetical protein